VPDGEVVRDLIVAMHGFAEIPGRLEAQRTQGVPINRPPPSATCSVVQARSRR
jgi:hypothetical protein